MPLYIEIVSTYTYTYSKNFLSVMVFVDLWIFATFALCISFSI